MQGQFIYTKFAFEALNSSGFEAPESLRPPWSLKVLEQHLPPGTGVTSMYHHSMQTLTTALAAERPDLLRLLSERVLPVLATSRELLTVQELVWAAGGDANEEQASVLGCHALNLYGGKGTVGMCVCVCGWLACVCGWLACVA